MNQDFREDYTDWFVGSTKKVRLSGKFKYYFIYLNIQLIMIYPYGIVDRAPLSNICRYAPVRGRRFRSAREVMTATR